MAGYSQTVLPGSDHAELMTLALKHALVEREVAHLVLPDEVQVLPAARGAAVGRRSAGCADTRIAPPEAAVERRRRARSAAPKRPVIVVGHGARFDMAPVIALAERLGAPVLTTFKAKGQVSDHHPLGCGVLGRSGTPVASGS